MNEGEPRDLSSSEEHRESRIGDPLLAHELALSTKALHDAAAELRKKARLATRETVKGVAISNDRVKEAYREKAERIDKIAEELEKDAVSTIELMKDEPDEKKKRLMLVYELVKARTLAGFYTFFTRVDDLSAKDIWTEDDEKALHEYYRYMDERERERKRRGTIVLPLPALPTFMLRMAGFSDEEIERHKNLHLPRTK